MTSNTQDQGQDPDFGAMKAKDIMDAVWTQGRNETGLFTVTLDGGEKSRVFCTTDHGYLLLTFIKVSDDADAPVRRLLVTPDARLWLELGNAVVMPAAPRPGHKPIKYFQAALRVLAERALAMQVREETFVDRVTWRYMDPDNDLNIQREGPHGR